MTRYSPKGCLGLVSLKGTLPETKILAKMDGWKISRLCFGAVSRPIFKGQTCWESFRESKSIGVCEIQTFSYISVAVVLGWGWHPSTSRKLMAKKFFGVQPLVVGGCTVVSIPDETEAFDIFWTLLNWNFIFIIIIIIIFIIFIIFILEK